MNRQKVELTQKNREVLRYVRSFIRINKFPASVRDIQIACGISSSSVVQFYLHKLEDRGLIRRRLKGTARGAIPVYHPSPRVPLKVRDRVRIGIR